MPKLFSEAKKRAVAVARPIIKEDSNNRTVGVVEPRVVVKIPWAKVKDDLKKQDDCSSQKMSEAPAAITTGSLEAETTSTMTSEGVEEAPVEKSSSKKRHKHHKRKRRHHHKHSCNKRHRNSKASTEEEEDEQDVEEENFSSPQDKKQHENKLEKDGDFHITETLPEHFKLALEERLQGGGVYKDVRGKRGPKRKRVEELESDSSRLNPLKLIRRFVPGTDHEEYKIEAKAASIKDASASDDVVDLDAVEVAAPSMSASGLKVAEYLRQRMPLLDISVVKKVGEGENRFERRKKSDRLFLSVQVERLSKADLAHYGEGLKEAAADTTSGDDEEDQLPFVFPCEGLSNFSDLAKERGATTKGGESSSNINQTFGFDGEGFPVSGRRSRRRRRTTRRQQREEEERRSFRSYRESGFLAAQEEEEEEAEEVICKHDDCDGREQQCRKRKPRSSSRKRRGEGGNQAKSDEEGSRWLADTLQGLKLEESSEIGGDKNSEEDDEAVSPPHHDLEPPSLCDYEDIGDFVLPALSSTGAEIVDPKKTSVSPLPPPSRSLVTPGPADLDVVSSTRAQSSRRGKNDPLMSASKEGQQLRQNQGVGDEGSSSSRQMPSGGGEEDQSSDDFIDQALDDLITRKESFSTQRSSESHLTAENSNGSSVLSMPILFSDDGNVQDFSSFLNFQSESLEGVAPADVGGNKNGNVGLFQGDGNNDEAQLQTAVGATSCQEGSQTQNEGDNEDPSAHKDEGNESAAAENVSENETKTKEEQDDDDVVCLTPEEEDSTEKLKKGKKKKRENKSLERKASSPTGRKKKYYKTLEDVDKESEERFGKVDLDDDDGTATPDSQVDRSDKPKAVFFTDAKGSSMFHSCPIKGCSFWTRKMARMNRHNLSHIHGTRSFRCPDCAEVFTSLARMLRHDRKVHTGEKEYECKICEAEVTDISVHMKVHRTQKNFVCEVCNLQFRHKNSMVRHMVQHSGEKPYRCQICDTNYISIGRLKEHMKKKHPNLSPKSIVSQPILPMPPVFKQLQGLPMPKHTGNFAPILPAAPAHTAPPQQPMSYLAPGPNGSMYLITNPQPQPAPLIYANQAGSNLPIILGGQQTQPQIIQQPQNPQLFLNSQGQLSFANPAPATQQIFIQPPAQTFDAATSYSATPSSTASVMSSLLSPREAAMLTAPTPEAPTPEPSTEPLLELSNPSAGEAVAEEGNLEITNPDGSVTVVNPDNVTFELSDSFDSLQKKGIFEEISSSTSSDQVTVQTENGKTMKLNILERAILEIPDLTDMANVESADQQASTTTSSAALTLKELSQTAEETQQGDENCIADIKLPEEKKEEEPLEIKEEEEETSSPQNGRETDKIEESSSEEAMATTSDSHVDSMATAEDRTEEAKVISIGRPSETVTEESSNVDCGRESIDSGKHQSEEEGENREETKRKLSETFNDFVLSAKSPTTAATATKASPTPETPFECKKCGRKYKFENFLKVHQRRPCL